MRIASVQVENTNDIGNACAIDCIFGNSGIAGGKRAQRNAG